MAPAGDRHLSVSRTISAPAAAIFDVLADPTMHPVIDGSGTVRQSRPGNPERLELGSRFRMGMRIGVPYLISSQVVELEEGRRIAWQHLGHHRWRFELEPVTHSSATRVTETFDWSTARVPCFIELAGYPRRHPPAMIRTLERLGRAVEA